MTDIYQFSFSNFAAEVYDKGLLDESADSTYHTEQRNIIANILFRVGLCGYNPDSRAAEFIYRDARNELITWYNNFKYKDELFHKCEDIIEWLYGNAGGKILEVHNSSFIAELDDKQLDQLVEKFYCVFPKIANSMVVEKLKHLPNRSWQNEPDSII